MINIGSSANVTINNLTINGAINNEAKTKHGLNINQAGTVMLNNVTVQKQPLVCCYEQWFSTRC